MSVNFEFSFLTVRDASPDSNRTLFITSFCHRSVDYNDSCTGREDFTGLWFFPVIKVVHKVVRSIIFKENTKYDFFFVPMTFFKHCLKMKNRNVVEGDVEVCSVFVSVTSAPSFLNER